MSQAVGVFLLAPLLLIAPALLLAAAVVALVQYGPLGWLAAVLLVVTVGVLSWWTLKLVARWWRSTKAPVQPTRGPGVRR